MASSLATDHMTGFLSAYKGISKEVWLISVVQFINRVGSMVIFFLAVYLREQLGFSLDQVGVLMSVFGLGSLAGVYIGGKLVDRLGYYPVMLISLLMGGAMFFVVAELRSFAALCIGLPALTILAEGFRPAGHVAVIHYSNKDNYTRSTSLYRLAINLGFSIGPALGGIIATIDYEWVFRVDGMSSIVAGGMLIFLLRGGRHFRPEVGVSNEVSPWRDKQFVLLLMCVALYAVAFFQLFSVMSIYYKEVEVFTEREIGVLLAANGLLVAVFEMFLIYKIEKRGSPQWWIFLGCLLLLTVYVLLNFLHGFWWIMFLIVVISFSEMLAMPFMNTIMNQCASGKNKGHYAGLYVMAWSCAPILSPLIATQVHSAGGYSLVWAAFGLFCITAALAAMRIKTLR
jgi:predicted MFS family arabinose efflux permease